MTDITKQLAEALTECVEDSQAAVDQYVLNYGENWRPARLAAMRKIVANARDALAAYRAQQAAPAACLACGGRGFFDLMGQECRACKGSGVRAQQAAPSEAEKGVPASDPCPSCRPGRWCRNPDCGRLKLQAAPSEQPAGEAGMPFTPADALAPRWSEAGRVHDWRNYISEEIRRAWPSFTPDQRLMLARQAEEQAGREEWE